MAISRYGGPEELQETDLPEPAVGPDYVLVQVRAAGVNPVDAKIRAGGLDGAFPSAFPLVPGWDVAGTVVAAGPAVEELAEGDEVVGYLRKDHVQHGSYAELVAAPLRGVAPRPTSVGWAEAASLPLVGLTALQALNAARVQRGDTLLVHNASGGVGTMAVQLASRLLGARVLGTCGPDNDDHVRALGGEPLRYGEGLVERVREAAPGGVTAVCDFIGGEALQASPDLVGDVSRLVSIVDPGVRQLGGRYVFVHPDAEQLTRLGALVDDGTLSVHVSQTFPLAEAAEAHRVVEDGHVRGKVALVV